MNALEIIDYIFNKLTDLWGIQIAMIILVLLFAAIMILRYSLLGKKHRTEVEAKCAEATVKAIELNENYEEYKKKRDEDFDKYKKEAELKLRANNDYVDGLKNFTVGLAKLIPNEKVKKYVEEFDFSKNEKPVLAEEIDKAYEKGKDEAMALIDDKIKEALENGKNINGTPKEK